MSISTSRKLHLTGRVTTICPIWKMTAQDGTITAYAQHTRVFVFGGVTYSPAPIEIATISSSIGLKTNSSQLIIPLDNIVTRKNVEAGKWKSADLVLEYVNYLDPSMGSTGKQIGKTGKIELIGPTVKIEFRSLSSLLSQTIGELTSPADRNAFPLSTADNVVNESSYIITRNVDVVTSNRVFTVDGAALEDNYYRYGRIKFTSGQNNSQYMEIQENAGNLVTLQLPMSDLVAHGDSVELLAGYDGSMAECRDRFSDGVNFNGENTLPGLRKALSFPE